MVKLLFIVLVLLVLALVALLVIAATRPNTFRVERSVDIKAPPEKIFPLVDTLASWQTWSPYEKKDPAMKRTLSGAASGKGAAYAWDGNNQVGAGSMEIIESQLAAKVVMDLRFLRPMQGRNTAEFSFTPGPDGTRVVWAMHGPSPYLSKLMGVIFNLDKMIGTDFEVGLQNLKALAEKSGTP